MRGIRRVGSLFLLMVISFAGALSLGEAMVRVFSPEWAPRTGRLTKFWRYDPIYGWAHVPGQLGEFESYGFRTSVRINSRGYRGPERTYDRRGNARRVVVLGDSFVWGFGVDESEMFTHRLDRDSGGDFDVVNLGVSGYSTDQELLVYRNEGRRYGADTVVLVVATNDVAMNVSSVAYLIYGKPLFKLVGDSLQVTNQPVPETHWAQRLVVDFAGQSYLLNQMNRVRETWTVKRALSEPIAGHPATNQRGADRPFLSSQAERVTVRLIAQLGQEVTADGAQFLVVLVDGIYGGRSFGAALRELGLQVLELDDVIQYEDRSVHLFDGLHWNGVGHEIVARAIAPSLL